MSKAESYLPPSQITIKSLASVYLCSGIRSTCWDCECADHCEYGRIFCQMLRQRVKKQKHGWRGYELAAAPLIAAQERHDRAKSRNRRSAGCAEGMRYGKTCDRRNDHADKGRGARLLCGLRT